MNISKAITGIITLFIILYGIVKAVTNQAPSALIFYTIIAFVVGGTIMFLSKPYNKA
jgi:inner membrane protein involved in colicin E2 resistance